MGDWGVVPVPMSLDGSLNTSCCYSIGILWIDIQHFTLNVVDRMEGFLKKAVTQLRIVKFCSTYLVVGKPGKISWAWRNKLRSKIKKQLMHF